MTKWKKLTSDMFCPSGFRWTKFVISYVTNYYYV